MLKGGFYLSLYHSTPHFSTFMDKAEKRMWTGEFIQRRLQGTLINSRVIGYNEVEGNVRLQIIATDKKVLFDMTYVSQS